MTLGHASYDVDIGKYICLQKNTNMLSFENEVLNLNIPEPLTCIGTFDSYHWVIEFFIDTNCTIVEYDFAEVTIPSYMRYRRVQCNGITMKHDFDE